MEHGQHIWEDDGSVYVSQELFDRFSAEYRAATQARRQEGSEILQVADDDLKDLIRQMASVPATRSLGYILGRLRNGTLSGDGFMEHEALTTAFVVKYSTLFVSDSGSSGLSRNQLPAHLLGVHDEILDMRYKRCVHIGGPGSVSSELPIELDDETLSVWPPMHLAVYAGGRSEWPELLTFLDALMHERLQEILKRLKHKTGCEWTSPAGPSFFAQT